MQSELLSGRDAEREKYVRTLGAKLSSGLSQDVNITGYDRGGLEQDFDPSNGVTLWVFDRLHIIFHKIESFFGRSDLLDIERK